MISVATEKILRALQDGRRLSKYDAAEMVPCHQRTAQRVLTRLHKEGAVRIVGWASPTHIKVPEYLWGKGKNKPKPKPLTGAEKNRRRLSDPDIRERVLLQRRAKRIIQGAYRSKAQKQIFNLIVGVRNGVERTDRSAAVAAGHSDDRRGHQVF